MAREAVPLRHAARAGEALRRGGGLRAPRGGLEKPAKTDIGSQQPPLAESLQPHAGHQAHVGCHADTRLDADERPRAVVDERGAEPARRHQRPDDRWECLGHLDALSGKDEATEINHVDAASQPLARPEHRIEIRVAAPDVGLEVHRTRNRDADWQDAAGQYRRNRSDVYPASQRRDDWILRLVTASRADEFELDAPVRSKRAADAQAATQNFCVIRWT